jgi:hypothetical protein
MPIEIRFPENRSIVEGLISDISAGKVCFYTACEVRTGNVEFVLSIPPEITMGPPWNIAGTGNVLKTNKRADCNYSIEMVIDQAESLARAVSHYPFASVRTPSTR